MGPYQELGEVAGLTSFSRRLQEVLRGDVTGPAITSRVSNKNIENVNEQR